MLELQERPAPDQPSTISGGLGARAAEEAQAQPRVRTFRQYRGPWSPAQERRLAGANLVTVVLLMFVSISAAAGVTPLEAPAAVGRFVGETLGILHSDAAVARRPPV